MEDKELYFSEQQRFGGFVLWLLAADIGIIAFFVYLLLFRAGHEPMGVLAAAAVLLIPTASLVLFLVMKLETEVRRDGLYLRFFPFHLQFRKFAFKEIAGYSARTYHPILEYGGWGIRYTLRHGKAYNIRGNRGLQIEFKNGKRLLVGSQEPETLAEAMKAAIGGEG